MSLPEKITRPSRLIQAGPDDAKVIIVGEAPGRQEELSGLPFHGGSGAILNSVLEQNGLRRSEFFVTNVCHVRPPDNSFDHFYTTAGLPDLLAGIHQLRADIQRIRPNLVVALGAQPLAILAGQKLSIDNWRGSLLTGTLVPGIKILPSYHPAFVLRNYEYKAVLALDMQKIGQERHWPEIRRTGRLMLTSPDDSELERVASVLLRSPYFSVDIECHRTDSGEWALSCVGFANRPDFGISIPTNTPFRLHTIRELLSSDVPKIFHNGTFDITVLRDKGFEVNAFVWDTMLAHHHMYMECASSEDEVTKALGKKRSSQPAIRKGLKFLTSMYTDMAYYKDDGKVWRETMDWDMFYRYNVQDCLATVESYEKQVPEMIADGIMDSFTNMVMPQVEPFVEATRFGIRIDADARSSLGFRLESEISAMQEELNRIAGFDLNVKSAPEIQGFIFGKLGLKERRNRKSGNLTTDQETLMEMFQKTRNPAIKLILDIRERRDLVERYINASVDRDGRMRCSFDLTGTNTGRLSSRASIYGSGTNLQNQAPAVRRIFVADPGHAFIYGDYSQAEARVVAVLAREEGLIKLFADPTRDVHKENAARIFGKTVSDITFEERYLAKRVIHASNYGMGPHRLMELVNYDSDTTGITIDLPEAKRLMEAYFMLYPGIRETFWEEVKNELVRSRSLRTPWGRVRSFYRRWDEKFLKEAYAFIPQSTIGDLTRIAFERLYSDSGCHALGIRPLLSVHDSILAQYPEYNDDGGRRDQVVDAFRRVLDIPINIHGHELHIPTDIAHGHNWGDWDASGNPLGLRKI